MPVVSGGGGVSDFDVLHALRVAGQFNGGTDEWLVGLLHDILEDTDVDADGLFGAGVPSRIIVAVETLTRRDDEPYDTYIRRVLGDSLARRVKCADLKDNLGRMDDEHESLRPRYEEALALLGSVWP